MLCGSIASWFLSIGPSQMSKLASFLSLKRIDPDTRATYSRRVHSQSHRHGVDPTASIPSRNSPCNRSWCDGRARPHLDPLVSFTWLPRDSVSVGAPSAFDPQRPSRPSISAILPRSFLSPVSKGGRDRNDRVYVPVSIGTDLPTVPPGSGSQLSRVVKDRWRGVVSATTRGPERTVAKQQRCTHTTACPPYLRSSTGSSSARTKCPRRWWNSTTTSSRGSSTNVSWVRGRGGPQANTMGEETEEVGRD